MGTYNPLAADEKATRALLRRVLNAALAEQEELARRALMRSGAHFNRAYLRALRAELRNLAEERGIEITAGEYGDRLERALRKGVDSVQGASFARIDPQLLDMALANSEVLVQDILDEGVKLVNAEMAKIIVSGKSVDDVADALRENLRLSDGGEIPEWRADLIANSELHSVYRQGQFAAGEEIGAEWWEYTGPSDDRTEPVCDELLALGAMTLEGWQAKAEALGIEWEIFQMYGAHYGCRHTLKPAPAPDGARASDNATADADA